jgi:hypothetical protein
VVGKYEEQVVGTAREFVHGDFAGKVYPPAEKSGARGSRVWVVAVEQADVLTGKTERAEKVFGSKSRALDFYTELWLGMSRTEAARRADPELPGRATDIRASRVQLHEAVASGVQADGRAKLKREGLNLRKVAEVLSSYDLDPIETIADALVPVTVIDPDTGAEVLEHRLSVEQRTQIAIELLQYIHPKLKAVEMKIDGTLAGMSQEQLDDRLKLLLARAAAQAAKGDA